MLLWWVGGNEVLGRLFVLRVLVGAGLGIAWLMDWPCWAAFGRLFISGVYASKVGDLKRDQYQVQKILARRINPGRSGVIDSMWGIYSTQPVAKAVVCDSKMYPLIDANISTRLSVTAVERYPRCTVLMTTWLDLREVPEAKKAPEVAAAESVGEVFSSKTSSARTSAGVLTCWQARWSAAISKYSSTAMAAARMKGTQRRGVVKLLMISVSAWWRWRIWAFSCASTAASSSSASVLSAPDDIAMPPWWGEKATAQGRGSDTTTTSCP